jgi:hypothetical protein
MRQEKSVAAIDFERFGLSIARAKCVVIPRPHRHDELEMMVIERGEMTYLFGGTRIVVPAGRLAVHWAAVPHQTIEITEDCSYSLSLKLPLSMLLNSEVPSDFVQEVLHGKHFIDEKQNDPSLEDTVTPIL